MRTISPAVVAVIKYVQNRHRRSQSRPERRSLLIPARPGQRPRCRRRRRAGGRRCMGSLNAPAPQLRRISSTDSSTVPCRRAVRVLSQHLRIHLDNLSSIRTTARPLGVMATPTARGGQQIDAVT